MSEEGFYSGEKPVSVKCAFCKRFCNFVGSAYFHPCGRCPIYKHTGRSYCGETPYNDVYDMWDYLDHMHRGDITEDMLANYKNLCTIMYEWLLELHKEYQTE